MEIDGEVRTESTNVQDFAGIGVDAECCSKEVVIESRNATEMGPWAAGNGTEFGSLHVAEIQGLVEIHVKDEIVDEHFVEILREPEEALGNNIQREPHFQDEVPDVLYECNLELDPKREPSNEELFSNVSNPDQSPKHATSSSTISSQLHDVLINDQSGCGEITSACSQNSSGDVNSCVVLEIPEHVSTTGIRKITFKLRKRKEVCDDKTGLFLVKPDDSDEFHDDLRGNVLHNDEWNAFENAGMDLAYTSPSSCPPTWALKMPKKIISDNYPTSVEKLLATGILEGARVKYVSVSGEKEIPGIIRGSGYLCGCSMCNFSKVISVYEFELHAGMKTSHPDHYVYLETGKPIYSIVHELENAPITMLDDVIKSVAGSSVNEEYFQVWKANLQSGNDAAADYVYQSNHYQPRSSYPSESTEGGYGLASGHYSQMSEYNQEAYVEAPVQRKHLMKKPRHSYSSSAREQKKASKGGKRKRDNDLHKSLFMPNGLLDGTSLAYYSKGQRILDGYKLGNGIVCSCCTTEISPSQFEAHAGHAAKRQPYRHIYTSHGLSLHDIALMLASGQNLSTGDSADMCAVCGGKGELALCNVCPRGFHADCLGLVCLPEGDWLCPVCRDGFVPGRKASGKSRHVIDRHTRVVKSPEPEPGGCAVCRSQEFSAAKFDDRTMILCDQCEKEYHVGCLRESGLCDLQELPKEKWFCCHDCSKIFSVLQHLTSSGPEVIPARVSAAIHKKHAEIGLNEESNNDIQWCILSGKSRFPEHLILLSRAAAIFRECFDPILATSGRDLIPVMVYGRNISGQEFSGMYCVVLIVKSIVVSAALLRIFGREVAELPLVSTCKEHQGKGYFLALFSCIERLLSSMNVKRLVLPAAEEAEPMWMNKLGFKKSSNHQRLKYTRDFQLTMFQRSSLLEKEVHQISYEI